MASVKYFPYGTTRSATGTLDTDKLFTGQRLDDTGLYYYNARYYDATIGRFISADTIVPDYKNPQTLNRYSYCNNNPLKYTDPSGHNPNDVNGDGEVNVLDFIADRLKGGSGSGVIDAIFGGSAGVGGTNSGGCIVCGWANSVLTGLTQVLSENDEERENTEKFEDKSTWEKVWSVLQMAGSALLIGVGTPLDAAGTLAQLLPTPPTKVVGMILSAGGGFLHSVGWKGFDDSLYDLTGGTSGVECKWTPSDWGDIAWGSNPFNFFSYGRWGLQKDLKLYGPDGPVDWWIIH